MKAISLWEPWASLIALGHKTIELRSWRYPQALHQKTILICAAKTTNPRIKATIEAYKDPMLLTDASWDTPLLDPDWSPAHGLALCTAVLSGILEFRDDPVTREHRRNAAMFDFSSMEGAIGWQLSQVQPIIPFRVTGAQGFFDVDFPPTGTIGKRWVVHCREDIFDVYVGRPGLWGNPFGVGSGDWIRVQTKRQAVQLHRAWLTGDPLYANVEPERRKEILARVGDLKGQVLGCHCKRRQTPNAPCHADLYVELANMTENERLDATKTPGQFRLF